MWGGVGLLELRVVFRLHRLFCERCKNIARCSCNVYYDCWIIGEVEIVNLVSDSCNLTAFPFFTFSCT